MPIFDQGYQHWQGPLSGHTGRWLAVARHGARVQLKNRIVRLLVLVAWAPALALVAAVALWGLVEQKSENVLALLRNVLPPDVLLQPATYRATAWTLAFSFFFKVEMFFIMLLVAVAGPGLISRDLRFNALPLYFARPLTRRDYFLGKLGVIGYLVALVAVGPAVFAYVVGVCFSLDVRVALDTWPVLAGSVAYGLVVTLSTGTLVLALSSLTRRSLYVGIAWAGLWIISGAVGSILTGIHRDAARRRAMMEELTRWVRENPPPPGARLNGPFPVHEQVEANRWVLAGVDPARWPEAERWSRAYQQASQQAWSAAQRRQAELLKDNWRPLCSYTANLDRIADELLDTDTAWVTLGKAARSAAAVAARAGPFGRRGFEPAGNERSLAEQMVPQYPWWWSAAVLTGLLGLSTWTLTRRVKSLDRLR